MIITNNIVLFPLEAKETKREMNQSQTLWFLKWSWTTA